LGLRRERLFFLGSFFQPRSNIGSLLETFVHFRDQWDGIQCFSGEPLHGQLDDGEYHYIGH
uniref:Uncharacterized protein n=1 Tax=Ciona savignyi TaxID=51511 RepID=H2YNE9_CIOSA